jgi:hypothetical protein
MSIQNVNSILSQNPITEDSYVLVRSDVFLFLQLTNNEKDIFDSGTKTDSKPNVVFYQEDSDTKAILDYTVASDKDKSYLDVLFKGLNEFSGLSLTNASYLDERNSIDTSLNASLQFREFKNNMLFTKVLSPVSSGNLNKVFDGIYFLDTPQITTDASWSTVQGSVNSLLICTNPKTTTNFNNFSINTGDLVEIVNPNSANNTIKYEVLEYTTLNNKQIIKLKTLGIEENLIGSSTVLNFYAKAIGTDVTVSSTLDNGILGCCYDSIQNKKYNATAYECYVRTGITTNQNYTTGVQCNPDSQQVTLNNGFLNFIPNTTITTTTPLSSEITNGSAATFIVEVKDSEFTSELMVSVGAGASNLIENNKINLSMFKTYAFYQKSFSNYKKVLRFSTSRDKLVPYVTDIFGTITETGYDTIQYLKVTPNTPSTLYLFVDDQPDTVSKYEIISDINTLNLETLAQIPTQQPI